MTRDIPRPKEGTRSRELRDEEGPANAPTFGEGVGSRTSRGGAEEAPGPQTPGPREGRRKREAEDA